MKIPSSAALVCILICIVIAAGCDMFPTDDTPTPVSISERIGLFEDGLNGGDSSTLYLHFHDDTLSRQSLADEEVFDFGPLSAAYAPFEIVVPDPIPAAEKDGTVVIDTTFSNNTVPDGSMSFVMKEGETDVWYIYWLTLDVDGTTYEIRKLY